MIPLIIIISKQYNKIKNEEQKLKDERIKVTNEVLKGIRIIKFMNWESVYKKKIDEIRQKEKKNLLICTILDGIQKFLSTMIPIIGKFFKKTNFYLL
jgi:ABC-type bacteriocin/lantibiotic exporter with double-glycine peptidase domain